MFKPKLISIKMNQGFLKKKKRWRVFNMCADAHGGYKRVSDPLAQEYSSFEPPAMGAENCTLLL